MLKILFLSVRLFESFEKAPTQKAVKKSGLKVNETEPNEQIAWENNKRLTRGKDKVIHPKYYQHLKKSAHQSHLGR